MIRYFASHPTAANVLMVIFILLGISALPHIQRDTFPLIPATEIEIKVKYPGATPLEVEDAICFKVEDALDRIENLSELRCDARENSAIVTAQMVEGRDIELFFNDIKAEVESITSFPDKVEKPTITKLERTATVATLAITGDLEPSQLESYAEKVRQRLKQDSRLAQVSLKGFSDQLIAIEISHFALQKYRLTLSDVQTSLEKQNIDLPAGILKSSMGDINVRFNDQQTTASALGELVIFSGNTGASIKLKDIAQISHEYENPEDKTLFNGKQAALLEIAKTTHQDSLKVMDAVKEHLLTEQQLAPKGISLTISADVTGNIRERLTLLLNNGIQGLVLVFLVMWLFFSLKFSFWVTMGLPVSFLGTLFVMHHLGYTFNMMTMVGLLVATGLLMDDAIVISENIAVHRSRGKSAVDATVDGTKEVMPGVIASFLTTAMIVAPIAFMEGKMGAVLKFIPAVLLITLLISLVEAFLILPSHLKHSIAKSTVQRARWQIAFDRGFDQIRDQFFANRIRQVIRYPYLALGICLGCFMIALASVPAGYLKYQAFPTLESDVIQSRFLLPQGTPLARTEEVAEQLVAALEKLNSEYLPLQPNKQPLVQNISVFFNVNSDAFESGPHLATVSADLLPAGIRRGQIDEMLHRWEAISGDIPDLLDIKFTDKERGVAGKAIDLRLQGSDLARLKLASDELQIYLNRFKGVRNLSDDLRAGKPEVRIHLKATAGTLGVNAQTVATEVRAALMGSTSIQIRDKGVVYDVNVRLKSTQRQYIDDLSQLKIRGPSNSLIPLTVVADLEQTRGYSRIQRVNQQRTVTIQGTLDTRYANAREIMGKVKTEFFPQLKSKYPDIRLVSQGEDKDTADTGNSLQTNIIIGLVGIYLILAFQFKNYLHPFAVLLSIPMAFIGVVIGHLALNLNLTMPSLVGFATLAGVVVNDNILLVNFVKQRLAEGVAIQEATLEAARDRFRPIMITSLTTIAGLLPLLLETSTQAQLLIPLVASLTFGLMAATVTSLFVVPVVFVIFDDLGIQPEENILEEV